MQRTTVRTARKNHRCAGTCGWAADHRIAPGDRYIEHVISPHHDTTGNPSWWRLKECASCAHAMGRGKLLEPEGARAIGA